MFFSVFGENSEFLAAVNHYLIESEKLDNCAINKTHFKIPALIIKEKSESIGAHFVPCRTLDQAIEVATIGIPVLDIDRIKESMHDHQWGGEIKDVDDDTDDIILAEEIIYRVLKCLKEYLVAEFLPTKQFILQQQILNPATR